MSKSTNRKPQCESRFVSDLTRAGVEVKLTENGFELRKGSQTITRSTLRLSDHDMYSIGLIGKVRSGCSLPGNCQGRGA